MYTQYQYNKQKLSEFKEIGDELVNDYTLDSDNLFVVENLIKWLFGLEFEQNIAGSKETKPGRMDKGIYIAGPCGTGKSLVLRILKQFSLKYPNKWKVNGRQVRPYWQTFHASELVNEFRNGEDLGYLNNIPMLGIDDIGSEPEVAQYMGNKVNVIRELLEVREDKGVYTILTSNYPVVSDYNKDIAEIYGERVQSRLKSLNYFELKGEDRR